MIAINSFCSSGYGQECGSQRRSDLNGGVRGVRTRELPEVASRIESLAQSIGGAGYGSTSRPSPMVGAS
jgi:hypothetical protein